MTPDEVPDELKAILDRAAGKDHSATGPVMTCFAEILTAHERMVLAKASALLMTRAQQYADTLTGPRASFRRGIEAAARRIAPKLTLAELAEAIRSGEAVVVGCDIPQDPGGEA